MAPPHAPSNPHWREDRKFVVSELYGEGIDIDTNLYDDGEDLTLVPCHNDPPCPRCGCGARHLGTAFVAIDGACKGNGTADTRAGVGVYFGRDSEFNITSSLNIEFPTSQKAELHACSVALHQIRNVKEDYEPMLSQVVIKADSEYVVKGMTEWIFKWEENGFRTSKGSPVVNAELFRQVEEKIVDLNASGVEVLFWHVPRARNKEADAWANMFGNPYA
ncbi:MAG: hypothetical protein MMC33_009272 [Icmadophila ericetorum]|nr:hypothetical protein [Icmadophila ericetorum]